jgi:hypothetical protein
MRFVANLVRFCHREFVSIESSFVVDLKSGSLSNAKSGATNAMSCAGQPDTPGAGRPLS